MFRDENVIFEFTGPMGVRVQVGQSLVMLVGLIIYMRLGSGLVDGVIFAGLLFTAIFLHELGHAWGCKVQGVPVRRIMLNGGGGFCEPAKSSTRHEQELIVAMGPIVNLGLWAVTSLLEGYITSSVIASAQAGGTPPLFWLELSYHLHVFAWINLVLVIFNMIPVQPLDGGKLFHLLMLRLMAPGVAHRVTGGVGLILSILWLPAAVFMYLYVGWILFFIPSVFIHYRMMRGELA